MKTINHIYINSQFVTPHGNELFELVNPTTEETVAQVQLADVEDTRQAIAAAKAAFPMMRSASREQQVGYESPSQFNREYRRSFGAAPLQDVETLRQMGVTL